MIRFKKLLGGAVLGSAAVLTLATLAYAQQRGGGGGQRDIAPPRLDPQFLAAFRPATAEASKGTVRVLCDDKEAALGTVVGPDGWIITKYSLMTGKVSCKMKNGTTLEAKITGIHEPYDLAMLKVEATNLPAVKLVESKVAPVGNWLVSVGLGDDPVAVGVMSVATRTPPPAAPRRGGRGDANQANQPPRGGGGGGPGAPGGGGGGGGGPGRPGGPGGGGGGGQRGGGGNRGGAPSTDFLGINVTPDGTAAKVGRVAPQSAGERAGLKVDDKIISIEGNAVTDQASLLALLGKMKPGDAVTIKLVRDGKDMELKATLQPAAPGRGRGNQNEMGSELSGVRGGFPTYFQTDTVIKPKDCGGPVCDLDGHVIGINLARVGRVESYAIATESLTPLMADLMSGKLSPKAVAIAALEKSVTELKAALKKAEDDKVAAEAKIKEAKATLAQQETDRAAAEKKIQDAKAALEKAEKELKDKM